ncbi:dna replication licensing factor mcm2 [Hordeum vulgare]|nr:dna replication licensing factor mcm2 [Hordeum vulgare]
MVRVMAPALCHVPETRTHILFSCVAAHALWCFVREAVGPEWEAHDLAEFLQLRATQVGRKRRLFWLVFAAMMWTLWTTRNKMVIERVFQRRASDSFFKFLAFLQTGIRSLGPETETGFGAIWTRC